MWGDKLQLSFFHFDLFSTPTCESRCGFLFFINKWDIENIKKYTYIDIEHKTTFNMKFIYNGKTYETPNLEKKLKRMHLTLDDVEILVEESADNMIVTTTPKEGTPEKRKRYYFWNKKDNTSTYGYSPVFHYRGKLWNEETKTGIRGFNPDDWVLLEGELIYPIKIGENGLPITKL